MHTKTDTGQRSGQNWTMTQASNHADDFAELTKDFQQLSSLYMIIYLYDEDRQEYSGATVSIVLMKFFAS